MSNEITIKDHASIDSFCKAITSNNLIPKHYQGNPGAVMVAVYRSQDFNVSPFTFMENTYIAPGGKLGMSTTFMMAMLNNSGKIVGNIEFETHGDKGTNNFGITAKVTNKFNQVLTVCVDMQRAQAENWVRNPKYKSMPDVMLRYRAASELIRTYFPEVLQGFYSIEELETLDNTNGNIKTEKILKDISPSDVAFAESTLKLSEEEKYQPPSNLVESEEEEEDFVEDNTHLMSELRALIDKTNTPEATIKTWLDKADVENLEELGKAKMVKLCQFLQAKL